MIGAIRFKGGHFEYWIGMLMAPTDMPPAGYDAVEIPEGVLGVCWVQGPDGPELYGMDVHEACMQKFAENHWKVAEDTWFVERYTERFAQPDENGNVILDYCAYLS